MKWGNLLMKVRKITLKENLVFEEVEDGFKTEFESEKNYPAFLSNFALKKGKEEGYIDSSLFSDLLKFQGIDGDKDEKVNPEIFENFDETKMLRIIYLAFRGANKSTKLSFDDFLERYHAPLEETMELYMNLIMDAMTNDPNQFADSLKKSTSISKKKGKK